MMEGIKYDIFKLINELNEEAFNHDKAGRELYVLYGYIKGIMTVKEIQDPEISIKIQLYVNKMEKYSKKFLTKYEIKK